MPRRARHGGHHQPEPAQGGGRRERPRCADVHLLGGGALDLHGGGGRHPLDAGGRVRAPGELVVYRAAAQSGHAGGAPGADPGGRGAAGAADAAPWGGALEDPRAGHRPGVERHGEGHRPAEQDGGGRGGARAPGGGGGRGAPHLPAAHQLRVLHVPRGERAQRQEDAGPPAAGARHAACMHERRAGPRGDRDPRPRAHREPAGGEACDRGDGRGGRDDGPCAEAPHGA
mmetsp:Transcript_3930/g.12370  ORF Transcript_3930/g.12370 Transcript_3930/m.12370 type:complete len:229 (+) Transcript_3930:167-853(+)